MFYLITILICMAIISLLNVFLFPIARAYQYYEIIFWVTVTTLSAIAIDGLGATIGRKLLPERWFTADKKGFCAGKKESKFYEKIGIKWWKDKVIELGAFTNFRKNKIANPNDIEYIKRYILEANFGVICHVLGVILGLATIFCCPMNLWLTVGLPVTIVNTVLSGLPILILRYNLPKLHTLYKYNLKRQKKAEN
ncbi:MAG: hypothetical protein IJW43_01725 [Clostridia bacterium]|nr:hypothetical protein [Clostridia bacterium]